MTRGYHHYRGRKSRGKIALAVLLVLIILAAVGFMFLQRYVVYDDMGVPQLTLPGGETEAPQKETLPQVELDVEEPPVPEAAAFRAFALKTGSLTDEAWALAGLQAEKALGECDGVAITLKDGKSNIYFESAFALPGAVKITPEQTANVLAEAVSSELHTIARICCFRDSRVANQYVMARGLMNTGGYIFYDGNNDLWLDPGKADARKYLCDLAVEAAQLGFDEILLAEVSYPLEGKLDKIAYGETPLEDNISLFLKEMGEALASYGVKLSVEVPEAVIRTGRDDVAGLVLEEIAPRVDRIYAQTTAEQAEALAELVSAAEEGVEFIPILEEAAPDTQCCLLAGS